MGKSVSMRLTTINIPQRLVEDLDELVNRKYYPNRAEAIRLAIRLLIQEHQTYEQKKIRS